MNVELTKAVNGDGYFRLKGKVRISPALFLALVQDNQKVGEIDPTVVYMKDLAVFDRQLTSSTMYVLVYGLVDFACPIKQVERKALDWLYSTF